MASDTLATAPVRWAPGDLGDAAWPAADASGRRAEPSARDIELEFQERAQREAEQRITDACTAAYERGRAEGALAESARLRSAVEAAEAALDSIRANEARWQESTSANIAALAVAVARHVVGRELATDAGTVAELVRRALAEFPIDQPMRVRVNPQDLSLLSLPSPQGGDAIAIAPNRDVRWMADGRILAGGCVVEGRERIIDGRVDTALERLYRRLTDTDA